MLAIVEWCLLHTHEGDESTINTLCHATTCNVYNLEIMNKYQLTSHSSPHSFNNPYTAINPLEPEFTIVIFIHYKPRIAIAILDL